MTALPLAFGNETDLEYDVYSALIEEQFVAAGVRQVVIRRQTRSVGEAAEALAPPEDLLETFATLAPETLEDFQDVNAESHLLDAGFQLSVKSVIVEKSELESLFGQGRARWQDFWNAYPESQGFLVLTKPGFNRERNQALVHVDHRCGFRCGRGILVLLTRDQDHWKVSSVRGTWVS